MVLRERSSGQSRGCAFVGYESQEEAEAAIAHMDRRVHLPGAPGPLEVRAAAAAHLPRTQACQGLFMRAPQQPRSSGGGRGVAAAGGGCLNCSSCMQQTSSGGSGRGAAAAATPRS